MEDVGTRVICANQTPDHTTIARFRQRHETALAELFGEVLALCAESGLVRVGVIAVDGTKVHANASPQETRDYEQVAREILEEADAVDAAEDERFGDARGDELPPELSTAQGRRGWLRKAKRRLDERRAEAATPIPRSRPDRLREAKRRLEEEHAVECRANAAYEAYRARGLMKDGRRFGRPPDPFQPPAAPTGKINVSDLDSRNVKTSRGWVQGYNAQAVCTEDQIVIAAEVNVDSPDFEHLEPMVRAALDELARAGAAQSPQVVLATPAIGTRCRWSASSATASRCSSRPTPRSATARGLVGTVGFTHSCAACSPPSTAGRSTPSARSSSSRSSPTRSSTAASIAFSDEAEPPRDRNGGWSRPPTTF
jgi:hypothetical protein